MDFDYTFLLSSKISLAAYCLLAIAIMSLWFKKKPIVFGSFLLLACLCALNAHRLNWHGLGFIAIYAAVTYFTFNGRSIYLRILCGILTFVLSILIGVHKIPGFANWLVANNMQISPEGVPYTLFLNFDKPLVGLFILGFGPFYLIKTGSSWLRMLKITLPIAFLAVVLISILAYCFHYVNLDLKLNSFFIIWAIVNLLFACIAEEALFRGLIQDSFCKILKPYRYGETVALILASMLFGVAHLAAGGINYMLLATVAGLFYGYAYLKTKNIEASIFTHFVLNASHFLGFTYPALQMVKSL